MKHSAFVLILALTLFSIMVSQCDPPIDPSDDPRNASVTLYFPDLSSTAQSGNKKEIGLIVVYPEHIKSVALSSSCGDIDTLITLSSTKHIDTLLPNLVFKDKGSCTLRAFGEMFDDQITGRTDSIIVDVLAGDPTLSFSALPPAFTTHTGRSDTLRFIVDASQVSNISYDLSCDYELAPNALHLIDASNDAGALVHFNPQQPGVYTVTLTATTGDLSTDASIPITVVASLSPSEADNPQTIITGVPDTLVYTLTPEQIANGVTMELLDAGNLPPDIATLIPSGTDSVLIAVNSAQEGTLSYSIATTNGTLTDTATYSFTFIDQSNAVWKTATATVDAVEGQLCTVPLTPYLFDGVAVSAISPAATLGSFDENGTWNFTPPWGSESTLPVTISGKRGSDISQDFSLTLNVASGDDAAPEITLLSPATESKTVSASRTTVSVIVKDAGAGVDNVTFATASATVDGSAEDDSTWSAVITGLVEGVATDVLITATDKSMKNNSSSRTIALTYDPSMEDNEAPAITQTGGPQSGDEVTTATGTLTFTITDGSGIGSVWWTLNDVPVSELAANGNGVYTISYEFAARGEHVIKLYAKDGSAGANEGSKTITLAYAQAGGITAITPSGPMNGASDVSLTPQFTWTGGTDASGKTVSYQVLYGTSATQLSQKTTVLTDNIITLAAEAQLTATTTYYWQVIAWSSEYPDTVKSAVMSFTTLDPTADDLTGPQVAQTAGPANDDRVMEATGTITVSVTDPNGVASVTAKLNSGAEQALTAGENNTYTYDYTISAYGANTITFTAVDGSANSNSTENAITLNYNTEPTAITLTAPAANATDVSTTPTFEWSGGEDADGDNVTVTVNYGTSLGQLTSSASVTGNTATISTDLAYQQMYYWQVTATSASTTYPDVVQSEVGSFTTGGSLPTISVHPQDQTKEEEQSVTFSVTADANGFGTLSYQWRKNGTTNVGTNSSSYTIDLVTTAMNNTSYDCVVSNEVGSETSNAATLMVTEIPTYTVTFWTENATPKPDDQRVRRGEYASRPTEIPLRDGYVFTDWYIENASSSFNFAGTPITEDLQLVAGWKEVYTVTYHKRNDESGTAPLDTFKYDSYEYATVVRNNNFLQKNGYEFIGWTINEDGTGTVYTYPNTIQIGMSDIHLYAKWEEIRYNISYSIMGGMGTHSNPSSYSPLEVETFTEASKDRYIFDGWYSSEAYTTKITSTQGLERDLQLYGRWIVASGTVSYTKDIIDAGTNNFTVDYYDSKGGYRGHVIYVEDHDASSPGYDVLFTTELGCNPVPSSYNGGFEFHYSSLNGDCMGSYGDYFTFLILKSN